ncbi:MAG: hypothetical protein BWY98_00562 [Tenericutes bacterium ADurb.BinA155]|jgi:hypothetical protein|nr:MAG: hypothetical protein BWY98_00562 [Tenericutes bacterium ADurb.BinA155]
MAKRFSLLGFLQRHSRLAFLLGAIVLSFVTVFLSNGLSNIIIYPNFRTDQFVQDPEFFYLFASLMLKGKTPYIDLFDHKGLYIFWFHALGQLMGGSAPRVGLFFLEVLNFIPVFYFMFLIFETIGLGKKTSCLWVLFFSAVFIIQIQGASDEEIELPSVVIPLYFYIRGLLRKNDTDLMIGNIFFGVSAGICLNLRPSDAMFALGAVIFYAIHMFYQKKWRLVLRDAALCLGALILTSLPAYIAAATGGYLNAMFQSVIIDSFRYVGNVSSPTSFLTVSSRVAVGTAFVLFGGILAYLYKRIDRGEWHFYAVGLLFVAPLQFFIGLFAHYWIMAYPYLILVLARFVQNLPKVQKSKGWKIGLASACLAFFVACSAFWPTIYYAGGQAQADVDTIAYVKKTISEDDRKNEHVLAIDGNMGVYNGAGIIPGTKDFGMQSWHSVLDDTLVPRLEDYLLSGQIHYVIMDEVVEDNEHTLGDFVENNPQNFQLVDTKETCPYIDIYHYVGPNSH